MKKLLAANRSEIAIRIFRAATELNLRTVAIYSLEDRLGLHRFKADEAYLVGQGKGPIQAYLDIEGIVALAREKEVDAIHPGYGFLAENPAFALACQQAGITFVGPSPELLELLGDKVAARRLAQKAGIPVVPGTEHPVRGLDAAKKAAKDIGLPLICKAAFGGGGRGMRIIASLSELEGRLEEAQREALNSFGNDSVFLERYIQNARHLEVQVLADLHGGVMHLYERDCSVQRRHQKIVETAPAFSISPKLRAELCEAAVKLARAANYRNAGTVEFLVDADSEEWFFIEVNPRIQVEHTVTEMVTGIDLVRAQILVAQGCRLNEAPLALPQQDALPLYGHALQCRITTEDPENQFAPDYGKITTYRSPAGFGIRLDGGTAYGGAILTPYYDSLLVKMTAWGVTAAEACQRMDRALREFRIRGVKTNIPFLENVVGHPTFQSGRTTTNFLDGTPELFRFRRRGDRATRLLSYLGDVIINGNPEVAGKPWPEGYGPDGGRIEVEEKPLPPVPYAKGTRPPDGTRQLLLELGPKKFAEWTRKQKRLLFTDTTFRDAHQSLLATRVRSIDILRVSEAVAHRLPSLFSLEMWGGATFDTALRFLHEDPWQRLRQLREAIPNICFQMLLRASNAVGYTSYPDNVVSEFVKESARQGIDIFRIFDSLNSVENMRVAMDAVQDTHAICEAAICYTGDILDSDRPKYSLPYYVKMAKQLVRMGAHVLAIKDMAGLCKPYAAHQLVKALREEIDIPIHFHTHDTSGMNAASILKAAEAGVDVVDGAISSMSGATSQPNLNSLVEALRHTPREPGLDIVALNELADYWEQVRDYYRPFDSGPRCGDAKVYLHEIPGGQYTNLREQAAAMGLGHRWSEVERTYAEVNRLFGDIVKVTPSSKVVGDMTLFLMTKGLSPQDVLKLDAKHDLSLPNSVIEMFSGSLGTPPGGWPRKLQKIILRGIEPQKGRPGADLPSADFEAIQILLEKKMNRTPRQDEVLSYLLYPDVFLKYEKVRHAHGDVSVLPTPQFFYGMRSGEEITVDIEAGKTLVIKFLTVSEAHPDGTRTVFFELNGQPREVVVKDKSLKEAAPAHPKVSPSEPGHVGSPSPGIITSLFVQIQQKVDRGERLLALEAMKMQSTLYAPVSGRITQILVESGQRVDTKDLLIVIEEEKTE
ncbi:MAG: pyruvate carboxylase [Acidobacteriota bacterium]